MGLDIALGIMVLFGAIRGWFRGFMHQAIRLIALVGCAYAASPIRDQARPYVTPYLSSVPAHLIDRLLWWTSASLVYLVSTGVAALILKSYRKRPYGEPEPDRSDQMAGLLFGGVKSAVVAAFMIAGFERNAMTYARQVPGVEDQISQSAVFAWNAKYHPAERIWNLTPVQHFVAEVRENGVNPAKDGSTKATESTPTVQTAATRAPRLDLPTVDINTADLVKQIDQALHQP